MPDASGTFDPGWQILLAIIAFCDPFTFIPAALGGWLSRRWWQLAFVAPLVAVGRVGLQTLLAVGHSIGRHATDWTLIPPLIAGALIGSLLAALARREIRTRDLF